MNRKRLIAPLLLALIAGIFQSALAKADPTDIYPTNICFSAPAVWAAAGTPNIPYVLAVNGRTDSALSVDMFLRGFPEGSCVGIDLFLNGSVQPFETYVGTYGSSDAQGNTSKFRFEPNFSPISCSGNQVITVRGFFITSSSRSVYGQAKTIGNCSGGIVGDSHVIANGTSVLLQGNPLWAQRASERVAVSTKYVIPQTSVNSTPSPTPSTFTDRVATPSTETQTSTPDSKISNFELPQGNGALAYVPTDARSVPVGYAQQGFAAGFAGSGPLSVAPISDEGGNFQAVLPPCADGIRNCIKGVQYQINGGSWEDAAPGADQGQRTVYDGILNKNGSWNMHPTSTWDENPSIHEPAGGTARIWTMPDAPTQGGNGYLATVVLRGQKTSDDYVINGFDFQITPEVRDSNVNQSNCLFPKDFQEINYPLGLCVTPYDFPKNINLRMIVKIPDFINDLNGWFDGRLFNPQISIDRSTGIVTIAGSPIVTPNLQTDKVSYSQVDQLGLPFGNGSDARQAQTKSNVGLYGDSYANSSSSLDMFNQITSKGVGVKTSGMSDIWRLSSIAGNDDCISKGEIDGVVSTNAGIYESTPPSWDSEKGTLNFQLASAHVDDKGSVFQGYYSLLLNAATASCLWGVNLDQAKATISITSSDGNDQVATTSYGVNSGWARFDTAGFTFSSPTIAVKLTQSAPVASPAPQVNQAIPSASASPQTAKANVVPQKLPSKVSFCVKGARKVKPIAGNCPKGYSPNK